MTDGDMSDVDIQERLSDAAAELRDSLEREAIPPFFPSRSPVPLAAVAALLVLLGLGVVWAATSRNEDPAGDIVVATQPDSPIAEVAVPEAGDADPADVDTVPAVPKAEPRVGQLSAAQAGESIVPLPSVSAWNADETAVLLYRTGGTGNTQVGHIVVSSATGELVAQVDLSPPDIEQIYWHPTEPTLLVALEGDAVWSFDIVTGERIRLHTFDSCPAGDADAGYPSPPSTTGVLVALCSSEGGSGSGLVRLQYNLLTRVETSEPAAESVASVHVSSSGSTLVSVLSDGSAIVETGGLSMPLDLGGDVFTFVTVDGVEQLAAARYDGEAIGSVVLINLADGSSRVVVGPDAGDEYPPDGTYLSGVGSRVVLSTRGPAETDLAGRVIFLDLARAAGDEIVSSFEHGSEGTQDYWSEAFISLSPSGRYAVYSTDGGTTEGGDRVDTYLVEFPP